MNQRKGSVLEEMSGLVARLNQQINTRRDKLAPLIRELRPLRARAQVRKGSLTLFDHFYILVLVHHSLRLDSNKLINESYQKVP